MPIYDFWCEDCQETQEIFQKMDDPLPMCEKHNVQMKKVLTKIHVRKGAGLYSLDSPKVNRFEE